MLLAIALAVGCKSGSNDNAESGGDGEPSGELIVFAAASLTDAFNAIAEDFKKAHPRVDVKMNFAGSQSLRTQIINGAQPNVFASANEQHMTVLRDKKLVDEPIDFAQNELIIVVPPANPAGVESLANLPEAERIVLAGETVPAGEYSDKVLVNASSAYGADFADRVHKHVVSRETHVRQTLQKVVLGEADAAIVYATDASAAGDKIKTIAIPREHNVMAAYPIATVTDAPRAHLSKLFVEYVRSKAGKDRLSEFGFRPVD